MALPGVMDLVGDDSFLACRDLDTKFNCLAVGLFKVMRLFDNLPGNPAIEVLDYPEFDGILFLVVANLDFKGFIQPLVTCVNSEVGSSSFSDEVEGVAGIDADLLIFWCMVNNVFADKFELTIVIPSRIAKGPEVAVFRVCYRWSF